MVTPSEVGLTAAIGTVGVGLVASAVQLHVGRKAARDALALARENRVWPERATAYIGWLAHADLWSSYRDGIDRLVTFVGQREVVLPDDWEQVERDIRSRVNAFASDEVRDLVLAAVQADKAFTVAVWEKRNYIEMHSATGRFAGDGAESIRLHQAQEERRAAAKQADERVMDLMHRELTDGRG